MDVQRFSRLFSSPVLREGLRAALVGLAVWFALFLMVIASYIAPGDNGHGGTVFGMQSEIRALFIALPLFPLGGLAFALLIKWYRLTAEARRKAALDDPNNPNS